MQGVQGTVTCATSVGRFSARRSGIGERNGPATLPAFSKLGRTTGSASHLSLFSASDRPHDQALGPPD
jgi:hypothetical protein